MFISKEVIEHLKDLARVEFGIDETERLAKDMGAILEHISSLKEADVSGVPEMTHTLDIQNIFRKDAILESARKSAEADVAAAESAHVLIGAFPEKNESSHGTYLKVKSIL